MPGPDVVPIRDLEDVKRSVERVEKELDAVDSGALLPMNVDMLSSVSLVLGMFAGIRALRDRIAKLPPDEFDMRNVDNLEDYAKAYWYLKVTTFQEKTGVSEMETEVMPLRGMLMSWANPLEQAGIFSTTAMNKIRAGSGIRDACSDLLALVALYRANWDQVRNICGVTEQHLERAALIAPAVFAAVARRENDAMPVSAEDSLRVRKAWTLLDRAYDECRRAVQFLRYHEGDADAIAPSLRRNPGRRTTRTAEPEAPAEPAAVTPATPTPGQAGQA